MTRVWIALFLMTSAVWCQQKPDTIQERDLRVTRRAQNEQDVPRTVPRGFAVLIGVGGYPNLDPDKHLRFSESDAQLIWDTLISKNGGNFAPEDVRALIGEKATLANIRQALEEWLPSVARENDRVVIYFAGHGFLDDEGRGYIAPWDVKLDSLAQTAYPLDRLGQVVSKSIKAKWKVLFADACHSGAVTPEISERVNDKLGSTTRDLLALTASKKREVSYEDTELKHGVFSWFLVQALQGQADRNADGLVTADELIDYVRFHVGDHTRKLGKQQTPIENQDFDSNLVLAYNPSRTNKDVRTEDTGTLVVDSNKDGVEFFLNGESRGIINKDKPMVLPGIKAGPHTVQGVHSGFYPDGPRQILVYPGLETGVHLRIQLARTQRRASVKSFEEAQKLYEKGRSQDLKEAVTILKKVLGEDPEYSQAALLLGRCYQVLYETDEALKYHKLAVKIDPSSVDARLSYAALLLDVLDTDEAIRQARQVLQIEPKNGLAYSHLAHAYRLALNFDQSEDNAKQAMQYDKSNAQSHLWLAECMRYRKKYEDARKQYLEYLRMTDFEANLGEKLAFYLFSTPFTPLFAKKRPTQIMIFKDQRNLAEFGLCVVEEQLGNLNEAASHCRKALRYDPNDPYSHFELGSIALEKYNVTNSCTALTDARESYRKVMSLNKELDEAGWAKQNLAQIDAVLAANRACAR